MALSKKQIAVILAIKNKKAGGIKPISTAPGFAPIPSSYAPKVPSITKADNIKIPKAPSVIKFPKLRTKIRMGK